MLHDKIQELEIELEDSNTAREKEVLVKEIGHSRMCLRPPIQSEIWW